MTDYNAILDTECEPDAPVTSQLVFALRDNPVAITEGAVGAPRNTDASLSTTVTTAGNTWVRNRTATSDAGAVGTYAMLRYAVSGVLSPGRTTSGARLRYSSASGVGMGAPSGTWRCMGRADGRTGGAAAVTLFLRVS